MLSIEDIIVLSCGILSIMIALMAVLLCANRLLDDFQKTLLRTVSLGTCVGTMASSAVLLEWSSFRPVNEVEGFPKDFPTLIPLSSELCEHSRRVWISLAFVLILSSSFLAHTIVPFLQRLALYPGRWVLRCGLGIFGGLCVGAYAQVTVWDEFLIVLPVTLAIVRIAMIWVEHVHSRRSLYPPSMMEEEVLLSSLGLDPEKPSWTLDCGLLSHHNCDNHWDCEKLGSSRTEQLSLDIYSRLWEKVGSYDSDIDLEDKVVPTIHTISRTTTYPESETDFSHSNGDQNVDWKDRHHSQHSSCGQRYQDISKANLYSTRVENSSLGPGIGHMSKQLDEDQKKCSDGKKPQDTAVGDVPILDTC